MLNRGPTHSVAASSCPTPVFSLRDKAAVSAALRGPPAIFGELQHTSRVTHLEEMATRCCQSDEVFLAQARPRPPAGPGDPVL